jgi:hypothetical protein
MMKVRQYIIVNVICRELELDDDCGEMGGGGGGGKF